jgi:hypothetical protein
LANGGRDFEDDVDLNAGALLPQTRDPASPLE